MAGRVDTQAGGAGDEVLAADVGALGPSESALASSSCSPLLAA